MNDSLKLLFWPLAGPYDQSGAEPWAQRRDTIGEVLQSDAYDFIVLSGVSAPRTDKGGVTMLGDLVGYMPGFSFTYTRHMPKLEVSEGLVICHRHSRWESDMDGGFRIWPPNTIRALFCVLYYELDENKQRTGRGVYVASSQIHNDIMRNSVITMMLYHLAHRPHPEFPVIWAGDTGVADPAQLPPLIGREAADPEQEESKFSLALQDTFALLHPESGRVTSSNNWQDYEPEAPEGSANRRDYVLISDGFSAQSLDFNYIRTPGGQFPSNRYPQRAVLSFNDRPMGQLLN